MDKITGLLEIDRQDRKYGPAADLFKVQETSNGMTVGVKRSA